MTNETEEQQEGCEPNNRRTMRNQKTVRQAVQVIQSWGGRSEINHENRDRLYMLSTERAIVNEGEGPLEVCG